MKIAVPKQVNSQLPLQRLFLIIWPFWLPRAETQIIRDYFRGHRWTREERSNG